MLWSYVESAFGAALFGPLGPDDDYSRPEGDIFFSRRSPIDGKESDFRHLSSSWMGVRLDAGSPITARGQVLDFTGSAFSGTAWSISKPGAYTRLVTNTAAKHPFNANGSPNVVMMGYDQSSGLVLTHSIWLGRYNSTSSSYRVLLNTELLDSKNKKWYLRSNYPYGWVSKAAATSKFFELANASLGDDLYVFLPIMKKLVAGVAGSAHRIREVQLPVTLDPPDHHAIATSFQDDVWTEGDLSLECVKQVSAYSTDTLIFASKLPALKDLPKALPHSPGDLKNPKFWANLFLSAKYGLNLEVKGATDIYEGMSRYLSRIKSEYRSTRASSSLSVPAINPQCSQLNLYHCKLKYFIQDNPVVKAIRNLYDYNLMPTIGTAWDMIPYSFVLDWVVNVSDVLDTIDYGPQYATLSVRSVGYSKLATVSGPISPKGNVWLPPYGVTSDYSREIRARAQEPIPRFKASPPTTDNVITAVALFIQRLK